MSKIRTVQAWVLSVPLLEEWAASPLFGPHVAEAPRLILRLLDEDGVCGWGEGPWLRKTSLLKTPLVVESGTVRLPEGPGLGIEVALDQMEPYILEHFSA